MKPTAIIVDFDGTLIDTSEIQHLMLEGLLPDGTYPPEKDFTEYIQASLACPLIQSTVDHIRQADSDGHYVLFLTARKEIFWHETSQVLWDNDIPFDGLFMRRRTDFRNDAEMKREYLREIREEFEVLSALEDSHAVISMYLEEQLPVLPVTVTKLRQD